MTVNVADAKDAMLGKFARELHDWFERARNGTLDPKEVVRAVHPIIDRGSLFVSAFRQYDLVIKRNQERSWGFTEKDFSNLGEPPVWPEDFLSAVVLEVSLGSMQKTFEEAWHFTKAVQPDHWRWPAVKSGKKDLRLLSGIKHQRGLKWRVIDLAANWDQEDGLRPEDVRNPENSPHSAILWAASYFPKWIQAMDGAKVPYVWLPGYQLSVSGRPPWSYVPYLRWVRALRRVRLYANPAGYRYPFWAVPAFREC